VAKAQKRMTKSLSCIFYQGARQIAQADFCTVKFYCRAPSRITHGEHALLCVTCSTVTKKTNDTARETASNRLCRAPGTGRTANNETFVVRLTLARPANKRKKIQQPAGTAAGEPPPRLECRLSGHHHVPSSHHMPPVGVEGGGSLHAPSLLPTTVGGRRGRRAPPRIRPLRHG
jgi:hypothetical protein